MAQIALSAVAVMLSIIEIVSVETPAAEDGDPLTIEL